MDKANERGIDKMYLGILHPWSCSTSLNKSLVFCLPCGDFLIYIPFSRMSESDQGSREKNHQGP